jgi:hypothetical protein
MGPTAAHRPTWGTYRHVTDPPKTVVPDTRTTAHRNSSTVADSFTHGGRPDPLHWRAARSPCTPARIRVHEPAQPSHLPHRDAAAAPVGGLATRQTLVDGHRQQRAASALLRVPDGPIAFAECSQ